MPYSVTSRWSRPAAAAVGLLGLFLLSELPGINGAARYLGVLTGLFAVAALTSAARLWITDCYLGRLIAATVAVACLVGEVLNHLVGVPGAPALERPQPTVGLLALLLEVLVVTLVILDARARSAGTSQKAHYALYS